MPPRPSHRSTGLSNICRHYRLDRFSRQVDNYPSLDIHKFPSVKVDTAWQVHKSNRLVEFLQCASDTLEKKKKTNQAYKTILGDLESFMLQYSVWRARGAGREDFMDHWINEEDNPQSHAEINYAAFYPVLEEIKRTCGELKKL